MKTTRTLVFLRSSGSRRPQAALFQLRDHRQVFEICWVAVKGLQQLVSLLPLRAIEQLHLIGQALSLVDGLLGGRGTVGLVSGFCCSGLVVNVKQVIPEPPKSDTVTLHKMTESHR